MVSRQLSGAGDGNEPNFEPPWPLKRKPKVTVVHKVRMKEGGKKPKFVTTLLLRPLQFFFCSVRGAAVPCV